MTSKIENSCLSPKIMYVKIKFESALDGRFECRFTTACRLIVLLSTALVLSAAASELVAEIVVLVAETL